MTSTASTADSKQQATAVFHIVVPVDGSDLAAKALPIARDLCQKLSGELILVRVVAPVVGSSTLAAGYDSTAVYVQLQEDAEREARDYLQRTAASLKAEGIPVTTRLENGAPGPALPDILSGLDADLVVMTTHGRTGLARTVLGSVADAVVRGGKVPVLLLRSDAVPPGTSQGAELSRALVPLDGTALAETPLFTIGLQFAGPVLHQITLLRVVDPKDGTAAWTVAEEYLDAIRQRLIDRLQEQGRPCIVSWLARWGSEPSAAIVESSQSEGCDLVLMATHSAAGIGRVVFGDVTDRVLSEGKTPLLLMHPLHG